MRIPSMARFILFSALAATLAPAAAGADDRGALLERIDGLVSESMEATQTPGISVAVQHRGELILARGYGLGLFVGEMAGRPKIEHGGGINGFLSQLSWYPDDDLIVTVLANCNCGEPGPLEARIARAGTNTIEAQGRNSVKSRTDASLVSRNPPTAKAAVFTASTNPRAST